MIPANLKKIEQNPMLLLDLPVGELQECLNEEEILVTIEDLNKLCEQIVENEQLIRAIEHSLRKSVTEQTVKLKITQEENSLKKHHIRKLLRQLKVKDETINKKWSMLMKLSRLNDNIERKNSIANILSLQKDVNDQCLQEISDILAEMKQEADDADVLQDNVDSVKDAVAQIEKLNAYLNVAKKCTVTKQKINEANKYVSDHIEGIQSRQVTHEEQLRELGIYDAIQPLLDAILNSTDEEEEPTDEEEPGFIEKTFSNYPLLDPCGLSAILSKTYLSSYLKKDHAIEHLLGQIDKLLFAKIEPVAKELFEAQKICDNYLTALYQKNSLTQANWDLVRATQDYFCPIQYGYTHLELCRTFPEDKEIKEPCSLYLYIRYDGVLESKIYCATKDKTGNIERFEIPRKLLGNSHINISLEIPHRTLRREHEKAIFSAIEKLQGDRFKLSQNDRKNILDKLEHPQDKGPIPIGKAVLRKTYHDAKEHAVCTQKIVEMLQSSIVAYFQKNLLNKTGNREEESKPIEFATIAKTISNLSVQEKIKHAEIIALVKTINSTELNEQEKINRIFNQYKYSFNNAPTLFKKENSYIRKIINFGYLCLNATKQLFSKFFHKTDSDYSKITTKDNDEYSQIWKDAYDKYQEMNNQIRNNFNSSEVKKTPSRSFSISDKFTRIRQVFQIEKKSTLIKEIPATSKKYDAHI